MDLNPEVSPAIGEEIKLGIAGRRELRAVQQEDRRRQKFRVSKD